MLLLLLVLAVVLGFLSGSVWLFGIAITALTVKIFPLMLIVIVISGVAILTFKYYYKD